MTIKHYKFNILLLYAYYSEINFYIKFPLIIYQCLF